MANDGEEITKNRGSRPKGLRTADLGLLEPGEGSSKGPLRSCGEIEENKVREGRGGGGLTLGQETATGHNSYLGLYQSRRWLSGQHISENELLAFLPARLLTLQHSAETSNVRDAEAAADSSPDVGKSDQDPDGKLARGRGKARWLPPPREFDQRLTHATIVDTSSLLPCFT